MKIEKLLEECPKATEIILEWFYGKMLESMPKELAKGHLEDFIANKSIVKEQVKVILEHNPRSFFDIFDEHKIYIEILVIKDALLLPESPPVKFSISINGEKSLNTYNSRINAEKVAIEDAYHILETFLT